MLVYSDVGFIYTTCILCRIVLISYAIYVPGIFFAVVEANDCCMLTDKGSHVTSAAKSKA